MCLVLTCYHGIKTPKFKFIMNDLLSIFVRSMLPDVIDEATLKTDVRREELFYAFFVFGNKFGSGVTLGISTAIYKSVK